mgnify:CR=1 FL=1
MSDETTAAEEQVVLADLSDEELVEQIAGLHLLRARRPSR